MSLRPSVSSRFIEIDGAPVHYADFGGSGPALVCVHGLGGSWVNWLAVGPQLARHTRVVALDLIGFGRTPPAGRSSSLRSNRRLLSRFLEDVVAEPAFLVGNSLGGLLALQEAAAQPRHVRGLVLLAPAVPKPRGSRYDPTVARLFALYAVPGIGEAVLRRGRGADPLVVLEQTLHLCCVDPAKVPREVIEAALSQAQERTDKAGAEAAFLAAARSLLWTLARPRRVFAEIARVGAPALLVQGSGDRLVQRGVTEELARRRPGWTLEVLPGVGHLPQLEAPDAVAGLVERWLRRTVPDHPRGVAGLVDRHTPG